MIVVIMLVSSICIRIIISISAALAAPAALAAQ